MKTMGRIAALLNMHDDHAFARYEGLRVGTTTHEKRVTWLLLCFVALFAPLVTTCGSYIHAQSLERYADNWVVSAEPHMVYGWTAEMPSSEFTAIVGIAFSLDGRVAIADRDLASVSVFAADGELITSMGRTGEGPGEFGRIGGLVSGPEGHLFVLDVGRQRFVEWTFDGELIGDATIQLQGRARPIGEVGRFADRSWYVRESERMLASNMNELAQDSVGFFRLHDNVVGERLAQVGAGVSTQFIVEGMPATRHALLSPRPLGVPMGNCLLVGTSDVPVLRVVDRTGIGKGEVRLDVEVNRAGEEHRREWVRETIGTIKKFGGEVGPRERRVIESMGKRVQMAPWIPFAHDMVVDSSGYIWVQPYELPEGAGSSEWRVFTGAGGEVGAVKLPEDLRVVAVKTEELVAVWTSELGQQEVRLYELDRRGTVDGGLPPLGCG